MCYRRSGKGVKAIEATYHIHVSYDAQAQKRVAHTPWYSWEMDVVIVSILRVGLTHASEGLSKPAQQQVENAFYAHLEKCTPD